MRELVSIAETWDIPDLVRLLTLLFGQDIEFEPDPVKQAQGLDCIIRNREIGEILVLRQSDRIVGMVSILYSVSTALGGKVAILEDMIIDPLFRGRGFGSKLLKEAISFAQKRNCLRITLLTDYNNQKAIRFYEKYLFTRSAMIPMRLVFD